jgi:C4-dicarboxylate-specific signal transduction histidine kinase
MSTEPDVIGQEEIRYFGKVAASISHELKNVLAILNEHAGLLQDFVAMAAHGRPLDVERIRQLSDGMLKQIGRGDTIVRNMNRFAHTADHERATADLVGLVELSAQMFGRTASARGATVQVQGPAQPMMVATHPFVLETLVGKLLDRLTGTAFGVRSVDIGLRWQGTQAQIRIPGLGAYADPIAGLLAEDEVKLLVAVLDATVEFSVASGELGITLPGNTDAGR